MVRIISHPTFIYLYTSFWFPTRVAPLISIAFLELLPVRGNSVCIVLEGNIMITTPLGNWDNVLLVLCCQSVVFHGVNCPFCSSQIQSKPHIHSPPHSALTPQSLSDRSETHTKLTPRRCGAVMIKVSVLAISFCYKYALDHSNPIHLCAHFLYSRNKRIYSSTSRCYRDVSRIEWSEICILTILEKN